MKLQFICVFTLTIVCIVILCFHLFGRINFYIQYIKKITVYEMGIQFWAIYVIPILI